MRTRLALALLIVVAPISALLVISHVENLKDQRRAQVESYQAIGDTLRASIDGFARDLESLAFAASIALSDFVTPTQAGAGPYLESVRESYGDLSSIFVTDLDGVVVATDGESTGVDLSERSYVQALQAGDERVWTGADLGIETTRTTTVHGRVIRSPAGEPTAYLFVAFYPSQLASRLPDLSEDSNVSLIDADGHILYTSADEVPPAEEIAASPVFTGARDGSRVLIESEASPTEAGERYGAFLGVPRTNWVIGFTRPAAAIDGPFESRLQRDIAIMVLLIAGGVGFMFVVAARLSKPLSSLSSTADAIARGEQPTIPIDAADADVLRLERAVQLMSQAINEREDRLLSQTRILETLERVGETLATELDFEDAVSSISVAAQQLTQARSVGIYYMAAEGDRQPRLLGVAGEKRFPLPSDDPTVRRTLEGEVLDVPELGVFPGAHQPPQLESGGIVHSFLGIPITSRFGDVHGGLFLLHDRQAAFTERHRLLAAGLARRASIVVENARLYSQARQQQEELREASMQKSEFIGMMSHELRTPITTIFGGARLLNSSRRSGLDQESFDEMIASIEEESERLYRLVEDLLMLAKSDLYENLDIDILTIGPVLDQAVKQFSNRHPGRPINVTIGPDVPLIMAEPAYLHQVLTNLISNADKYSDAGLAISIDVSLKGDNVVFKVMDRGPGVDPSELEMIFESFFRSESTARRASGKGLGLTVCRRLIEAMSGTIWAANRKEGGLEVCFALPVAVVDMPDEEDTEPGPLPAPEPQAIPRQVKTRSR